MLDFCSGDPGWFCAFHFHSKEVVKSPGSLASPGEMNYLRKVLTVFHTGANESTIQRKVLRLIVPVFSITAPPSPLP